MKGLGQAVSVQAFYPSVSGKESQSTTAQANYRGRKGFRMGDV